MTKAIFFYMTILTTFSSFAMQNDEYQQRPLVKLNSKTINLGALLQVNYEGANENILIERSNETPKSVKIKTHFNSYTNQCVQWQSQRVITPGRFVIRCRHRRGPGRRNRQRICRRVWVPGRVRIIQVCTRYNYVPYTESQTLVLKFKKAAKLSAGETELFNLNLRQSALTSTEITPSAEVIQSSSNYRFDLKEGGPFGIVFKRGLYFIAD